MDGKQLSLSIGPPILAVAIQLLHIPGDRSMRESASELERIVKQPIDQVVYYCIKGNVELSSIAPNIIGFLSGAFALFYFTPDGAVYIYILLGTVAILFLSILSQIDGRSAYYLAIHRYVKRDGHFYPFGAMFLIDVLLYSINIILIVLSICLFFFEPKTTAANGPHERAPASASLPQIKAEPESALQSDNVGLNTRRNRTEIQVHSDEPE